jgi:hypothetical protein
LSSVKSKKLEKNKNNFILKVVEELCAANYDLPNWAAYPIIIVVQRRGRKELAKG